MKLGAVVHAYNHSTREAEAGGTLKSRPARVPQWVKTSLNYLVRPCMCLGEPTYNLLWKGGEEVWASYLIIIIDQYQDQGNWHWHNTVNKMTAVAPFSPVCTCTHSFLCAVLYTRSHHTAFCNHHQNTESHQQRSFSLPFHGLTLLQHCPLCPATTQQFCLCTFVTLRLWCR